MEVINLFESDNYEYWLDKIKESTWSAGFYLYNIIMDKSIFDLCGKDTMVMLLINKKELISFCTLANLDDIQPTNLTLWIGFVYTFEKYRNNRYAGILIDECCNIARKLNYEAVYISTNHMGLYEKYGFEFYQIMKDISGEDSKVYKRKLY